jgi:hypothetical protein
VASLQASSLHCGDVEGQVRSVQNGSPSRGSPPPSIDASGAPASPGPVAPPSGSDEAVNGVHAEMQKSNPRSVRMV